MLKLLFYFVIGIIVLAVLIGTPLVIKLRKQGERIGRVNSQDATMLLFMKMYTLVMRARAL